jgi:predicted MFS family arabinose efflux permease
MSPNPRGGRYYAALTLLAACLVAILLPTSITGTSVALPAIGADLHSDVAGLQWVINAYNLTFASFLLATGSLSDIIGRRRLFIGGMALFAACSLAAGTVHSTTVLDIVRGFAGVGAAAAVTSGSAAIAHSFDGHARTRAFGLYGTCFGVGIAFGPMMAGSLTSGFGWRWFFLVQALVGVVILALAVTISEGRNPGPVTVDWAGTLTFTTSLFLLTLGLIEAPQLGWSHPVAVLSFLGFAVLLGAFVLVEQRQRQPMFDLSLFRKPHYVALCLTPVALAFGFVALLVFLPSYFMAVNNMPARDAGFVLLLLTAPTLVMPAVAAAASKRLSIRFLLVTCLVLVAAGTGWLTVIEPGVSILTLAGPLLTIGIGFGISNGILDGAAVSSVEPQRAGMAAGMFNTMRITGEVVAIAALGSLLVSFTRSEMTAAVGRSGQSYGQPVGDLANLTVQGNLDGAAALVPQPLRATFTSLAQSAYTSALDHVLWVLAAVCLLAVPALVVLLSPARATAPAPAEVEPADAALLSDEHTPLLSDEHTPAV